MFEPYEIKSVPIDKAIIKICKCARLMRKHGVTPYPIVVDTQVGAYRLNLQSLECDKNVISFKTEFSLLPAKYWEPDLQWTMKFEGDEIYAMVSDDRFIGKLSPNQTLSYSFIIQRYVPLDKQKWKEVEFIEDDDLIYRFCEWMSLISETEFVYGGVLESMINEDN